MCIEKTWLWARRKARTSARMFLQWSKSGPIARVVAMGIDRMDAFKRQSSGKEVQYVQGKYSSSSKEGLISVTEEVYCLPIPMLRRRIRGEFSPLSSIISCHFCACFTARKLAEWRGLGFHWKNKVAWGYSLSCVPHWARTWGIKKTGSWPLPFWHSHCQTRETCPEHHGTIPGPLGVSGRLWGSQDNIVVVKRAGSGVWVWIWKYLFTNFLL